jgi:lysophospholipase L1-like esterase
MPKWLFVTISFFFTLYGCTWTGATTHVFKETSIVEKEEPPKDFIPKEVAIVAIGDSLTKGVGDRTNRGGYVPYLQQKLESLKSVKEVTFESFGVRGLRSDQLLKKLDKDKTMKNALKEADIVIITIGGNDVMKVFQKHITHLKLSYFEEAKVEYEKRLQEIIQHIRKENKNIGIVLVGLYNPFHLWFSDIKEIDAIIRNWNETGKRVIMQYPQTSFVSIEEVFYNKEDELLYDDYFHPNEKGYAFIAERLFYVLEKDLFHLTENIE